MTKKQLSALNELQKKLNEFNLNALDLIEIIGNLCYTTGVSIAGLDYFPTKEMVINAYKIEETLDIALMMTGFNILSWKEEWNGKTTETLKMKEKEEKGNE